MIYLASPYSDPDPFIREQRYLSAAKVLVERYLSQMIWAYSPIVHCHELAKIWTLPREFQFWKDYNQHMLILSTELHVLRLAGWQESAGIAHEIDVADKAEIPVKYI